MDVNITGFPKKITVKGFDKIGDVNIVMVKGEKGDKGDAEPPVITTSDINSIINDVN